MNEKKGKVIEIGYKNESIQSCINVEEIFQSLKDPDIKENLDKCLKTSPKLFTH